MLMTLTITQIIIGVLLSLIILIQPKKSSLNLTTFWSEVSKFERRWPEKILHNTTIVLGALFIINALIIFFIA